MKKLLYLVMLVLFFTACGGDSGGSGSNSSVTGPSDSGESGGTLDYSVVNINSMDMIYVPYSETTGAIVASAEIENTSYQNLTGLVYRFYPIDIGRESEAFELSPYEIENASVKYETIYNFFSREYILRLYILRKSDMTEAHAIAYKEITIYVSK